MELKLYSATELTRIYALRELIGEEGLPTFASRVGMTAEGLDKYLKGVIPITKKSGRKLSTRLGLPYDYFELAAPGTKNKYNSSDSYADLIIPTALERKSLSARMRENAHLKYSEIIRPEYLVTSPQKIGQRLQEDRIRLNFGLTRFASLMSVDVQTQSQYESGSVDIPAEYLRIAELTFKIDAQYVLTGTKQPILFSHQEQIGKRLKEERLRKRLTEYQFADAVSASLSAQMLYESGVESIPASYLSLAAINLHVDVVYILTANRTYSEL